MARQTIIDWQRDGLIVAVGQLHAGSVTLEKLCEQSIGPVSDGEDSSSHNVSAAGALVKAVDELGLRKSDVTVVVSRELVEVRTLFVPRIDPNELPDVIRFQAQRQLSNMGDSWTLDYVLLPDEPGQEMHTALVGVIAPAAMAEIESACALAGVQLVHIALRPIEIARFAVASGKLPAGGPSVVVCVSEQQADLMILNNGNVVQVRGMKLPSEPSSVSSALGGELRRSLMAASSQLGNKPLAGAMLFASSELAPSIQQVIADAIGCSVSVMDPVEVLPRNFDRKHQLARSSANRIAGMAGATNFSAADTRTKLDFNNPKKRPPPKSKSTTYLLATAAAALLALAGISWWVSTNRALDQELAQYEREVSDKKELVKISSQRIADWKEIESFLDGSLNWLEELSYISENIPAADKVVLDPPSFLAQHDGTGKITMSVYADSRDSISEFEKSLRDDQHVVRAKVTETFDNSDLYKWRATETITVTGRGWKLMDQLVAARPASPPATKIDAEAEAVNIDAQDEQDHAPDEPKPEDAVPIPDEEKTANAKDEGGSEDA